jgi:hypothetical protein
MRPVMFLLLLTFSSTLFASECSEIKVNDSTNEIIELQGLAACKMRASLYLYALSRNHSKEVYKNFYECEGHDVDVKVERFRKKEITNTLVSVVESRGNLEGVEFKTNVTTLSKLISHIEKRNKVECVEFTRYFSKEKELNFQCGDAKMRIEVTPYISCTDSWKSL